jgi:hypothetical protein
MRYLLGALLFTTTLFAAESRFSEAEAKFNREYDAAKAVFDRAVKVARDKLVVAYNEEMKRLTAKGDLDGAVAIREKIKNFEKTEVKVLETYLAKAIVGKWIDTKTRSVFMFDKDKWTSPWGDFGGTWIISNNDINATSTAGNNGDLTISLNVVKMEMMVIFKDLGWILVKH